MVHSVLPTLQIQVLHEKLEVLCLKLISFAEVIRMVKSRPKSKAKFQSRCWESGGG